MSVINCGPSVVVVSVLLALVIALTGGQDLPSRKEDEYHVQENYKDIFYDTNRIPDGNEVTSYVRKDVSSRFFFFVEEDDTPLAIHVAPCSSSITTRIRYQTMPEEDDDSEKLDANDELLSQMRTKDLNKKSRVKKLLQTHTGRNEVKFQRENSPSGLYSVEVTARDRDTTVYLYASTTPHSDQLFPALPEDANIRIVAVSGDVVSVSWKPSPTDLRHRIPVEYCVAANRKRNFAKRCAALAGIYGDAAPTPPPNAGFWFPWEKEKGGGKGRLKTSQKNKKKTTAAPPAGRERVFYACVGNKTSYVFSKLEASTLYYIDVFAVNNLTNRSSVYAGTNVTTAACPVQKAKIGSGRVYGFRTKAVNCSVNVEYALEKSTGALEVAIQSCKDDDRLRVSVRKTRPPGSLVERELVPDWPMTKISLPDAQPGSYSVHVSSVDRRNVAFRMAVGAVEDGLPFPVVPGDRTIRVVNEDGRSCRSVTLMWNVAATDQPQQYCLYMERVKAKARARRRQDVDRCAAARRSQHPKASKKVTCKAFANNGTHGVDSMVEVVSDLKPSTRYRFEVVVRRQEKEFAAYDTVDIKTKKC